MKSIAAFISPHGFGHATRTIAILESLQERMPDLEILLFTTVPAHLFGSSSLTRTTMHPVTSDVGLVQHDALSVNMAATADALDDFLPFSEKLLTSLCRKVDGCFAVLSDISPLGIAVGKQAGIPSILVENFTWDWIYRNLPGVNRRLLLHADHLQRLFTKADYRFQVEPVCQKAADTVSCPAVFRKLRQGRKTVRDRLDCSDKKLVLVSMGGMDYPLDLADATAHFTDILFILAGQKQTARISMNCHTLSHDSGFYHPDLIGAADLVICKSGYSTLAECLQSGTRVGCISREDFAESAVLARYVKKRLGGTVFTSHEFTTRAWLSHIPAMLAALKPEQAWINGADVIADFLLSLPDQPQKDHPGSL